MALSLTPDHSLVKLAKAMEKYFGSKANYNFCVSQAMREDLECRWGIKLVYFIHNLLIKITKLNIVFV